MNKVFSSISRAPFIGFLILSISGVLFVYRGAIWNESLLAPLDIAPEFYPKYRWMDPQAKGIPQNHYIIDIFDYELPRNYLAYQAFRNGEFPWWDPYSSGGRPLIAEAHISFTDPLRLVLYQLFSFERSYNLIRVLHSFLLGLGALVLLRHLNCSGPAAIFGAISFQFSAAHTLFFFPAYLQATYWYYPFLWVLWSSYLNQPRMWKLLISALACAGAFFAGNQQSHAFLPLYAACFCAGYAGHSLKFWKTVVFVTGFSGFFGALIALPVLGPQYELYLLCEREHWPFNWKQILSGPASLAFVFPWALGTFRTVDLSKLFVNMQPGIGFAVYLGTSASLLAFIGLWHGFKDRFRDPATRTSAYLLILYFVAICCTPLLNLFYTRSSGLALLGLMVCSARAFDLITAKSAPLWIQGFVRRAVVLLTALVIALNTAAFIIYPRVVDQVRSRFLNSQSFHLDEAPALRSFQVNNLPNEISLKNAETFFAFLGGLFLVGLISKNQRLRKFTMPIVILLNIAPLLLFAERYIVKSPLTEWHRFLGGGPEQNKLISSVGPADRFLQDAAGRFDNALPGITSLYYRLHNLGGYSSFPLDLGGNHKNRVPDWRYLAGPRGAMEGELSRVSTNGTVRFVWAEPNQRVVEIERETLNSISLRISSGRAGKLIRTDTYYPGWHAENHSVETVRNNAGFLEISVPPEEIRLSLKYIPSRLRNYLLISGMAALLIGGLGAIIIFRFLQKLSGGPRQK